MEKEQFNLKVTEIDKGYKIEVTGDNAIDFLKDKVKMCCVDGSSFKDIIESCCAPAK